MSAGWCRRFHLKGRPVGVILSAMSMRTTLSGCTLSKIRQAIGGADDALVEMIRGRVEEEAAEYEGDEDEEGAARMRDTLGVIVAKLEGGPAPVLEDEGHVGYLAATGILEYVHGDDGPRTPFEVKHAFWSELSDKYGDAMGADAELFRHLEEGRPLFGRTINNECFYAWLDRADAVRLRNAAIRIGRLWREKAERRSPPLRSDMEAVKILTDEHQGLAGCIDKILAAGYDLWFETT